MQNDKNHIIKFSEQKYEILEVLCLIGFRTIVENRRLRKTFITNVSHKKNAIHQKLLTNFQAFKITYVKWRSPQKLKSAPYDTKSPLSHKVVKPIERSDYKLKNPGWIGLIE